MRRGFTLIELLVVLVIIGVIAALLFSAFVKVQSRSRQTDCLSHERQLGVAMMMYIQDYDEQFPRGAHDGGIDGPDGRPGGGGDGVGWAGEIFPYVKSTAVFHCPDDLPYAGMRQATSPDLVIPAHAVLISYGYNAVIPATMIGMSGHLARMTRPAETLLLFEISGDVADVTKPDEGASEGVTLYSAAGDGISLGSGRIRQHDGTVVSVDWPDVVFATGKFGNHDSGNKEQFKQMGRHGGGANYLMGDGHAQWLRPELICTKTHSTICPSNATAFFEPRRDN